MNLGKTPWVDRHMSKILPLLKQRVPETWLPRTITEHTEAVCTGPDWEPRIVTTKFKKPVVEEYGCGSYGCVMPTNEPGLVIKLTTDVSEAWFIARAMSLEETVGIVEYKGIYAVDATHSGKPLFVLWRTEARDVGAWSYARTHKDNSDYARQVGLEAMRLLNSFKEWASIARDYLQPKLKHIETTYHAHQTTYEVRSRNPQMPQVIKPADNYVVVERHKLLTRAWRAYESAEPEEKHGSYRFAYAKGMARVGIALRSCLYIAQEMQGNPSLYNVGAALQHYLESGIVLADVHSNNLGLAFNEDEGSEAIITDPGHAVEFHPQWAELAQVPML
jgi:hypothetical protein